MALLTEKDGKLKFATAFHQPEPLWPELRGTTTNFIVFDEIAKVRNLKEEVIFKVDKISEEKMKWYNTATENAHLYISNESWMCKELTEGVHKFLRGVWAFNTVKRLISKYVDGHIHLDNWVEGIPDVDQLAKVFIQEYSESFCGDVCCFVNITQIPCLCELPKPEPEPEPEPIPTTEPEQTIMSKTYFETQHLVNGVHVDNLSNNELIDAIKDAEKEIKALEEVKTPSTAINGRIKEIQTQLEAIAAKLDDRAGS